MNLALADCDTGGGPRCLGGRPTAAAPKAAAGDPAAAACNKGLVVRADLEEVPWLRWLMDMLSFLGACPMGRLWWCVLGFAVAAVDEAVPVAALLLAVGRIRSNRDIDMALPAYFTVFKVMVKRKIPLELSLSSPTPEVSWSGRFKFMRLRKFLMTSMVSGWIKFHVFPDVFCIKIDGKEY